MTTAGRSNGGTPTLPEHKVRILLVDDFAPIRKLMLLLLSEHQGIAEVLEAEDGPSAIHLCERFKPDLVLLDFWMPGMDGAETARHIKSRHPETRIVAYSAVLEVQPPWADALVVKDAVPDPDRLVQLARGAA
jgi:CheY-like chemotaxis protein